MGKSKKQLQLEAEVQELTADLQRSRADFENYRNRVEQEKNTARIVGQTTAITKLLPTIDNIERAIGHVPEDLHDNPWASGVTKLTKNLQKSLESMGVERIDATPGTSFDPELHEAIQFDEDDESTGHQVITEELQAGYRLGDDVIRHAMVRVKG